MTAFVSRPLIGLGTIFAEYASNPMIIVLILSCVNIVASFIIKEPGKEEEEVKGAAAHLS